VIDIDDMLTNGQWVLRGAIRVWVENPRVQMTADFRPHDFIACPTCHARMDEKCQRRNGKESSHSSRLVRRVCACGASVRPREPMCGFCRAEMTTRKAA
jgi:hypothetical protein